MSVRSVVLVVLVALASTASSQGAPARTEWSDATGFTDIDMELFPYTGIPVPEVDIVRAWLEQTEDATSLSIQVVDLSARTTPGESLDYAMNFNGNGCESGSIRAIYLAPLDQWFVGYSCFDGSETHSIHATLTLDHEADVLRIDVPAKVFTSPASGRISTFVCTYWITGCATLLPVTFHDTTAPQEIVLVA